MVDIPRHEDPLFLTVAQPRNLSLVRENGYSFRLGFWESVEEDKNTTTTLESQIIPNYQLSCHSKCMETTCGSYFRDFVNIAKKKPTFGR
ncbi:hypothetical protein JTE90_000293 [Oedothorax gibbosus]|uniref:Uncharacterized protein n=1 Tax=Oedothorax gibbosus TaxID=931172 RepID=A0AAV6VS05_9ARAC|nr:hypothetical protein JTE90_000293 [Oedothorax gibbosus]